MGVNVSTGRPVITKCDLLIVKEEKPEILSVVQDIRDFARDVYVNYVVRTVRVTDFDPRDKYICRKVLFFVQSESVALQRHVPVWMTSLPNIDYQNRGSYLILSIDRGAYDEDAGIVRNIHQNGINFRVVTVPDVRFAFQWWPIVLRFIHRKPHETPPRMNILYTETYITDRGMESSHDAESRTRNSVHEFLHCQSGHVRVFWSDACRIGDPDVRLVLVNTSDEFRIPSLRKYINKLHPESFVLVDWDIEEEILKEAKVKVFPCCEYMKAIFPIMMRLQLITPRRGLKVPLRPDGPVLIKKEESGFDGHSVRIELSVKWKPYTYDDLRERLNGVSVRVERLSPNSELWETVARDITPSKNRFEEEVHVNGPYQYRVFSINAWGVVSDYISSRIKYV